MNRIRKYLSQIFCRHVWTKKRTPMVLVETGEYCGVVAEYTCKKCSRQTVKIAIA